MHETPPYTGRSVEVGGRRRPRAASVLPTPTLLEWTALTVYHFFLWGGGVTFPGQDASISQRERFGSRVVVRVLFQEFAFPVEDKGERCPMRPSSGMAPTRLR